MGIRFPVYPYVTKMDLWPALYAVFPWSTSHLRAQVWGFTLPYSRRCHASDPQSLHALCSQELET
ncbi:type VI secretion protein IcmF/TssM N-terminal domain-containing protein [Escherichia coli]